MARSAAACAVAAFAVARRLRSRSRWMRAVKVVEEFESACETPLARLRQVVDAMAVEMHAGLASDGGSKLKMLPTFVDMLPRGREGTYYALDLGGANVRVLRVKLGNQGSVVAERVETHIIPRELTVGADEDLFNFLALTLKNFVKTEEGIEKDTGEPQPLGFTFSFPVRQASVSSGRLIKWTKGFAIENAVGKDVAELLDEAMARCGLNMRVTVLVNDTVGTLAVGRCNDQDTVAAVILGTGTNACYIERTDALIKCQGLLTNSGGMIVNMEWGNFWTAHLPRTSHDIALDEESENPHEQGFEKMISGMYLGEIARRVLYAVAQESDIFGDSVHRLSEAFVISTTLLAAIRSDCSADLKEVQRTFDAHLEIPDVPLKTRRLVAKVCDLVTRRAARLAAAAIVGVLKKIGRDGSGGILGGRVRSMPARSVVVIEGLLYNCYPVFREYLDEAVMEILGEVARNVELKAAGSDAPGLGAALLAAGYSSPDQQGEYL